MATVGRRTNGILCLVIRARPETSVLWAFGLFYSEMEPFSGDMKAIGCRCPRAQSTGRC